jgi:N-acetylglucosamine-6-sulfatase
VTGSPRGLAPARRVVGWLVGTLMAVTVCATLATPSVPSHAQIAMPTAPTRPNIILITTDDQALYDLAWMPNTRELIGGHGVTFDHGLSPHPLCCPARAEIVTGQYAQNNGVKHNTGPHGGYPALRQRNNTVGRWLHDAGYQTAMVGKYLNGYHRILDRPRGWDHWNPFTDGTRIMTTQYYDDGAMTTREGYVDDITNEYAIDYIDEFSASPEPFFLWVSNYAPHRAQGVPGWRDYAYPAPRFLGKLTGQVLPVLDEHAFNEKDVSDQPPYVRRRLVDPAEMQKRFTYRIEALQAADEGVKKIVDALAANGELDDTYIVFTSDNGYLLGEHRLEKKNYIFKEALEVPFLVRVPSADAATTSDIPVTMVDIAPTVAELAGAQPERLQDGASFAGVLAGGQVAWRDTQLIQTGTKPSPAHGWWIRGVRTNRYTYGKDLITGVEQLYDRRLVPGETRNVALDPTYARVLRELRRRLTALRTCAGADCSVTFGPPPSPS